MWPLIQVLGGITLVVLGVVGIVVPLIPGIFLIYIGVSLIIHITVKKAWFIFKERVSV